MPVIGLGAEVLVDDGASSAFVVIDGAVNLTVPDVEGSVVESKRLDLPGGLVVKIPGLKNAGSFTFEYEFTTVRKTRLDALVNLAQNWKVNLPTIAGGTTWTRTVPGILTSNKSGQVQPGEIQMVTCTVEVSGPAA